MKLLSKRRISVAPPERKASISTPLTGSVPPNTISTSTFAMVPDLVSDIVPDLASAAISGVSSTVPVPVSSSETTLTADTTTSDLTMPTINPDNHSDPGTTYIY